MRLFLAVILVVFYAISQNSGENVPKYVRKTPSVLIVTLVRNKAHTLPIFLSYLENLDYPKESISLWFKSDHNEDNSVEILSLWLERTRSFYHSVNFTPDLDSPALRDTETNQTQWPEERYLDIIRMKEEAFQHARNIWADFTFFLDADVFLVNENALYSLVGLDLPVVAPMLLSDGMYSNFWCGMSKEYYYDRTPDYKKIRNFEMIGEHIVPMVHSAVLVNMQHPASDYLTFDRTKLQNLHEGDMDHIYNGPTDDIIIFAISVKFSGASMYVSNSINYGYVLVPLEQGEPLAMDYTQLTNTKIFIIHNFEKVSIANDLQKYIKYPEMDKLSFSEIFMINLERREERRRKMESSLKEIGLEVTPFAAVDGKLLTEEKLKELNIQLLPDFIDPYNKRVMTLGEIGCFLSHYKIWERMVDEGLEEVLVLEDDIKFEPFFKDQALALMIEAKTLGEYDLIYFGRKRLEDAVEEPIGNSGTLVKPHYSYWTIGYVLTLSGAKKLLNAKPLEKLVPVDEFLPIMFNQHPNASYMEKFEERNLIAWSAAPLLLYPTHYTGDEGYISDTEASKAVDKWWDISLDSMGFNEDQSKLFHKNSFRGFKEHTEL